MAHNPSNTVDSKGSGTLRSSLDKKHPVNLNTGHRTDGSRNLDYYEEPSTEAEIETSTQGYQCLRLGSKSHRRAD